MSDESIKIFLNSDRKIFVEESGTEVRKAEENREWRRAYMLKQGFTEDQIMQICEVSEVSKEEIDAIK